MKPNKEPRPMEVEVIKAKATFCKDKKYEDGRIEIKCLENLNNGFSGWVWWGMLVKDLYRGDEYHKLIFTKKPLYLALYGGWNTTLRVDMWHNKEWKTIWTANNDFESFAEEKKSSQAYEQFIKDEGDKVAKLIDKGKTLKEINKLLSKDHTGNTYGWAMSIGINSAKDKKKAQVVREAHNQRYGSKSKKGVVNPAILSLSIGKDD